MFKCFSKFNTTQFLRKIRTILLTNPLMIYKTPDGHILTRDATRVLLCCIHDNDDMIRFNTDIQNSFVETYLGETMSRQRIWSALEYLQLSGLITNLHGDLNKYSFTPTHAGIHFFEIRRKNLVYIFVSSILLPLLVSVCTTLITLSITNG